MAPRSRTTGTNHVSRSRSHFSLIPTELTATPPSCAAFPFRIFKSHFAPPIAPVKKYPKVKFLAMARNGMDVVRSFFPFFNGHRPDFKATWGGWVTILTLHPPPPYSLQRLIPPFTCPRFRVRRFPPSYPDAMTCLKDFLPGGTLDFLYFGYINDWWPYRHEPNVLLLHYSDAIKDLGGTVKKIAKFLGVDLNPIEHAQV